MRSWRAISGAINTMAHVFEVQPIVRPEGEAAVVA